ncbi:hopene-associated glycosyltransferase HpnB [Streptomyces sp. SolWspMP-5a-2]|nr:hopene-associated glycosyltransferase HpnB [Streptomyces sp. SolWspMP-5a-2]
MSGPGPAAWGRLRRVSAIVWIAALSLAAWLWLLLCQGFFWRTDVRLPPGDDPGVWPPVCVVVPARDEAAVLPASLPSLLAQDYPGRAEVFLVDDGSTDGTGELARALAREHGGLPLTVGSPGEPPAGWTGKLWAVRHGIGLARARGPEFLLLTDADIAHAPDSLRTLVAAAGTGGFDMVSQMARLRVESRWERLVVPAFVYFFAQLYPFRRIGRAGTATAAAAGGCVLLRAEAAERARVPDAIRQAVIDDVALARAVKGSGAASGWVSPTGWTACAPTRASTTCGGWCPAAPTPNCGTVRRCWRGRWPGSRWSTWCRRWRWWRGRPRGARRRRRPAGSPGW